MCGRYTLTNADPAVIRARFGIEESAKLESEEPRFNIAPTDPVLAIRHTGSGAREPGRLRWGLVPGRWAERRSGPPLINARAESIQQQPAFAESFRERRCLIPADGFYEWRKAGSRREPFHIRLRERRPFAFAGLWREEKHAQAQQPLRTCVIVTTEPNAVMSGIHDRMPAILAPEAYAGWLDSQAAAASLLPLLRPYPAEAMEALRVSSYVNGAAAEGPRCLEPERQASLFD
jgi:putative SOS response-associated peptidase YedK